MYHFVTKESSYKSNGTGDNDANVDAQNSIRTQSGDCLAADNRPDQAEPCHCGRVEKNRNGDEVKSLESCQLWVLKKGVQERKTHPNE